MARLTNEELTARKFKNMNGARLAKWIAEETESISRFIITTDEWDDSNVAVLESRVSNLQIAHQEMWAKT